MGYLVLGEAAMAVHFAFLAYVAAGGFLAWRWPRAFWPHLACAAYGLGIVIVGWTCPLTVVEQWARTRAGHQGLPEEGFVAHYLTDVVYPERYLLHVQIAVAAVVLLSWAGAAWRRRGATNGERPKFRERVRKS
ncbi:nicotinamide riboside transporter PnuC [Spinactinospora alkalitolerans]|uniref:Nicotinamide riboside transporter PnuC n=1 Tax=Spinactinospora alkalitolerans TaxID=687207 RepID=A0A852TXP6_9ACTN|nr:DUF2784 domain-containing protein [Spinactinospora alkalitolerans]NYE48531.1 nicotinamide riboside transporter PnuC [Spinactinospora alkalitolerans]